MKRFYIILAVLAFGVTACDSNEPDNPNAPITDFKDIVMLDDFYSFVNKDWEIDDNAFAEALVRGGLVQDLYLSNINSYLDKDEKLTDLIGSYTNKPSATKFVFSEDGTCRHYFRFHETGRYIYIQSLRL